MPNIREKLDATDFVRPQNGRSIDEVIAIADDAAYRAASIGIKVVRDGVETPMSGNPNDGLIVHYLVKTLMSKVGHYTVTIGGYADDGQGNRLPHMIVGSCEEAQTEQETLFFIPIMPKTSKALRPLQRFSRNLCSALDGQPVA